VWGKAVVTKGKIVGFRPSFKNFSKKYFREIQSYKPLRFQAATSFALLLLPLPCCFTLYHQHHNGMLCHSIDYSIGSQWVEWVFASSINIPGNDITQSLIFTPLACYFASIYALNDCGDGIMLRPGCSMQPYVSPFNITTPLLPLITILLYAVWYQLTLIITTGSRRSQQSRSPCRAQGSGGGGQQTGSQRCCSRWTRFRCCPYLCFFQRHLCGMHICLCIQDWSTVFWSLLLLAF